MLTERDINQYTMQSIAAPGSMGHDAWAQSRRLISQIKALPKWRMRRYELWNQYVFLRGVHRVNWMYRNGIKTPHPGAIDWL
jgi:hypothetical protein